MQATKATERTEIGFYLFLTSTLDGDKWSAICLGLFTLEVPAEQGTEWVSQRVWMFWRILFPLSGGVPGNCLATLPTTLFWLPFKITN